MKEALQGNKGGKVNKQRGVSKFKQVGLQSLLH